ncbi:hypothetical protein PV413_03495 [Streptomyces scabiei]|uniref:hypothetical protein n=1 Tax=Streptomyces scabiei TaxID=1930 RepID=UPI000E6773C3|nr:MULTISPECIES: hypothetical protein [Streptomyces]MDX2749594.1 hypothetical protein [Streptomyces scabiei]MDX3146538.1 hypothetical protein [Streptomyces scabiei]MDX3196944.1 hypothetical protein [Streptomyces scabiei]QTU45914.1 hypothetical protein F3K20_14495 [Streptomyces sp. LBUM 1482]
MFSRTKSPTARERALEAENRKLRHQVAVLSEQLAALQRANERMYAGDYSATGGPRFDTQQPFGSDPKRKLGTLPVKGAAS